MSHRSFHIFKPSEVEQCEGVLRRRIHLRGDGHAGED